ncbi:MAG: Bax inhibitor-1/YccA family protein [Verrucomicrobiaceae bacterium]
MNVQDIYGSPQSVALAPENTRTAFIRRTYAHLAGAIAAFILLEAMLFSIPGIESKVFGLLAVSSYSWLIVLGLFMAVSWMAEKWANSNTSRTTQYLGLGLYVVAEALIFLPLLLLAANITNSSSLIAEAGIITGGLFAGLTFIAFTTKKDFSFLGGILKVAGFIALGLIAASFFIDGLSLGIWFSAIMVLFAGGSILYQTSNIIHHYQPEQYVAASLGLFASVALLFWYVLRILMSFANND